MKLLQAAAAWIEARRAKLDFSISDATARAAECSRNERDELVIAPLRQQYWNSPCTRPDKPGVYAVMAGVRCIGRPAGGKSPVQRIQINDVRLAHWNGVRWGTARLPLHDRGDPGFRFSDLRLTEVARRFNPRQDYPWRDVPA